MDYLVNLAVLFLLVIVLQLVLADHYSKKWSDYRYLFFNCLVYAGIINFVINKSLLFYSYGFLLFLVATTVPLIMKKAKKLQILGMFAWREIGVTIAWLGSILLAQIICASLLPHSLATGIITALQLMLLLYPLVFWGYYLAVGDCLDTNSVIAVYQTHKAEVEKFLREIIPLWVYSVALVIFCVLARLLFMINYKLQFVSLTSLQILLVLILLAYILHFNLKKLDGNYLQQILQDSKEYLLAIKEFQKKRTVGGNEALKNITVQDLDNDPNACYVVIIGESQNKSHMSAYGYARDTTPNMRKMREKGQAIFFDHVYACHTLTMQVISEALSEASQYDGIAFGEAYSLLDIAKAAGYTSYWLSNHSRYGAYSTPVTVISSLADHSYWISGDTESGITYDEDLLPYLDKIPSSGKRLVIIHMFGNHYEYKDRYPQKYEKFVDEHELPKRKIKSIAKVNQYDNSWLYSDALIKLIVELSINKLQAKAVIFFPDHGEAVCQDKKHIPGLFVFEMVRISMFCYFSNKYKEQYPEKVHMLENHTQSYFSNDMFYDTMLGIMHLQTEHYLAEQDLSSLSYNYNKETLKTMHGEKNVVEDDLKYE